VSDSKTSVTPAGGVSAHATRTPSAEVRCVTVTVAVRPGSSVAARYAIPPGTARSPVRSVSRW
jgi:hypothetical protein